jgi:hypothetical protein
MSQLPQFIFGTVTAGFFFSVVAVLFYILFEWDK